MAGYEERLIVLIEARLDAFEKAMQRAERAGTSTYNRMQKDAWKATTAIEAQMLASAKAQGRALDSVFGQNVERAGKTARESANAFKEFDRARASVDSLRASLDPIYAASKKYEAAVEDLDRALGLGVISELEHARALDQAKTAYLGAEGAADGLGGGFGRLGNMSAGAKGAVQNFGFQVQDLAVQIGSGTSASQALGQQLPQLLSGFGLVGMAAGTLAAVGLPLVSMWFGNAEGEAVSFDKALGQVQNSLAAMNEQAAIYTAEGLVALKEKYGEINSDLLTFIDLQTQVAQRQALQDVKAAMAALSAEQETFFASGDWDGLAELFGVNAIEANRLALALRDARDAGSFEDQLAAVSELRGKILDLTGGIEHMTDGQFAFYQKVQESEDALRQLVAAAPNANWLSGMIGEAETLANKLWDAVEARVKLADSGLAPESSPRPMPRGQGEVIDLQNEDNGGSGRGRSSGGGGASKVDALVRDLQTERETLAAWYAESLETLNLANEAQLVAVGGKHAAIERLEAEHQERLRGIRDESNTGALAHAETFFGAMATLTASGGDRLAKISRAFAAAEALINTYRAQAQVLADPKLGFWAKLPAVAAIGAAGMGLVSSLGGSGRSSGKVTSSAGGSASGTAETASDGEAKKPLTVILQGIDPARMYEGATLIAAVDAIQKEFGNRGVVLGVR